MMENLCFVLWMVLFPLGCTVEKYINRTLMGNVVSDNDKGIGALIEIIMYIYIGVLLYK